jgi:transcriptional regulator with XRE-family HTH domain
MATKPNQALAYQKVPPFLRELRNKAGLSQRQLAAKVRRPQWWVARIEIGSRRIDVTEFIVFCEGCGKDPAGAIKALRRLS